MGITGIVSNSTLMAQSLADMRSQLDDLQRQLGSGQKSDSYAGVGIDRGLAVGLRTQLAAMSSFDDTITTVGAPLQIAQTTLGSIDTIRQTVKNATQLAPFDVDGTGQTTAQQNAKDQLDQLLSLLNTRSGDRYLFSGKAVDTPATDTLSHILDGDGSRAGFKQVMAERNQADLGANGLGRPVIPPPPPAGTVVSVSEDAAGSPFGLKLASVTSNLTNAAVTGPSGSPASVSVDFTAGNPNPGDTIKFTFNLPDGTSQDLTLTATSSTPPGANQFTIGATPDATAANLQTALAGAVGTLAATALAAASSVAAAKDFFNIDAAHPPQRVAGPPFTTATALTAGTPANTVSWYTGEAGSDPARSTAAARIDPTLTVSYGMRANEQALANVVQNVAVYAAASFSSSDPNAQARYQALADRLGGALGGNPGQQKVTDIEADLANTQAMLASTQTRHRQNSAVLNNLVDSIEGVSNEQVGAQLLTLNTQLQASLQTTALLLHTSLVNYLGTTG